MAVCRTPVPAVAVPALVAPPTRLFDIIARDIWENTFTQRDSAGVALRPTREGELFHLNKVHYLADALRPRSPKRDREYIGNVLESFVVIFLALIP